MEFVWTATLLTVIALSILVCLQILWDTLWGTYCCARQRDHALQARMILARWSRQGTYRRHYEDDDTSFEVELLPRPPMEVHPGREEAFQIDLEPERHPETWTTEGNQLSDQRGQIQIYTFAEYQALAKAARKRRFALTRYRPRLWSIREIQNEPDYEEESDDEEEESDEEDEEGVQEVLV